ncbi:MAG: DUF3558 family protein [Streptomyces sp.]|nr:DUF3558 family protein [Streptomyces sp.]
MPRTESGLFVRNRGGRGAIAATGLLLASVVTVISCLTGCSGSSGKDTPRSDHAPKARPSTSARSSATVPSGSPSSSPVGTTAHTLAELAAHPCLAIDDEDAGPAKLYVAIAGAETHYKGVPKSCEWGARGGLVDFIPYPSTDLTLDKRYRNLTPRNVAGHRTLLGTPTEHAEGSCVALVAVGPSQSFELLVTPFGKDAPGPDVPTVATNFAKVILSHLQ